MPLHLFSTPSYPLRPSRRWGRLLIALAACRPSVGSSNAVAVALLPLQDVSAGASARGLADTLTMHVIAAFDSDPAVMLVPFPAVQEARASQWSEVRIAHELRVQWIAEGTLVRSADSLRVTMHLYSEGEATEPWVRTFLALTTAPEELVRALRDSLRARVVRELVARDR